MVGDESGSILGLRRRKVTGLTLRTIGGSGKLSVGKTNITIEHGPFIVDFPITNSGFSIVI